VQVVIKRAALAQKFGRKQDSVGAQPVRQRCGEAHWDCRFDHDGGVVVDRKRLLDHGLNA